MQEEIEMRSVTLAISTSKLSGRLLKAAIAQILKEAQKEKPPEIKHGKQSVKQLLEKDAGASSIEASKLRIGSFDRVARKYGVDYAIYREKTPGDKDRGHADYYVSKPSQNRTLEGLKRTLRYNQRSKFYIFFKGRDADAVSAAFKEYSANQIRKETNKKSVVAHLHQITEQIKNTVHKAVKNKDKGLEL